MMVLVLTASWAGAKKEKFTFNDVELDGQTGEIEASVKTAKNKDDSVTCTYFTDDYEENLGYYFKALEVAPTDRDAVGEFCIENFGARHS